jgi:hypothetical protein
MMNEKEFNAERKRQIKALLQECTPKERWQIRRSMVKRRVLRLIKKVFKAVSVVLIGVIGLRPEKK